MFGLPEMGACIAGGMLGKVLVIPTPKGFGPDSGTKRIGLRERVEGEGYMMRCMTDRMPKLYLIDVVS